jgi:hypothetical protein
VIAQDLAQHLQSLEYATITGRLNIIQQWARKYYFLSLFMFANFFQPHFSFSACAECFAGVKEDCFHHQCITADGVEKGVMSINRLVPGPSIQVNIRFLLIKIKINLFFANTQVCKGDEIVVDVHNEAHGTAVTIHWHGLHQKNTPFMDGVPFVTQCPISFGNTFRYKFSAEKAGTFMYHSHAGNIYFLQV